MSIAGWTNEPPEDERPAMPVSSMLLSGGRGEPQPGAVLENALARARAAEAREAREAAASAPDPDERAASLIARGVTPGLMSDLSRRLGDTQAELQAEREKLERSQRRHEYLMRAHQAGQISAFDLAERMGRLEEGDEAQVARLERRAESLRRQLQEVSEAMSPQQHVAADPLEAATQRARQAGHEAFIEATRAKLAAAERGRPLAPPPFAGSISRGTSTEHTGDDCWVCAAGREAEASRGADPEPEVTRVLSYDQVVWR